MQARACLALPMYIRSAHGRVGYHWDAVALPEIRQADTRPIPLGSAVQMHLILMPVQINRRTQA